MCTATLKSGEEKDYQRISNTNHRQIAFRCSNYSFYLQREDCLDLIYIVASCSPNMLYWLQCSLPDACEFNPCSLKSIYSGSVKCVEAVSRINFKELTNTRLSPTMFIRTRIVYIHGLNKVLNLKFQESYQYTLLKNSIN